MLVSINLKSDEIDLHYDMRAGQRAVAAGKGLHKLPGGPLVKVSGVFQGDGCSYVPAHDILENLHSYIVNGRTILHDSFQTRMFFRNLNTQHYQTSATVYHQHEYWTFGLLYKEDHCVGEWIDRVNPNGTVANPIGTYRADPESGGVYYKIGHQEDSVDDITFSVAENMIREFGPKVHAATAIEEHLAWIKGFGAVWDWFNNVLVFPGDEERLSAVLQIANDFPAFRRRIQRLLPATGLDYDDVEQKQIRFIDLMNSGCVSHNDGKIVEGRSSQGRLQWLFPESFIVAELPTNAPPHALHLHFTKKKAEHNEAFRKLMEDIGLNKPVEKEEVAPPPIIPETDDFEAELNNEHEPTPTSLGGVPFGALNPEASTPEPVDLSDDDNLEDFDFDDIDFDDFDLEDFDFDDDSWSFENNSPNATIDDNLTVTARDMIYSLLQYDLAISEGKVVMMKQLGTEYEQQQKIYTSIIRYLLETNLTGQILFHTTQLDMIPPALVRQGHMVYQPEGKNDTIIPAWVTIPEGMLPADDFGIASFLRMLFPRKQQ